MPFDRPSLRTLIDRAETDLQTRMPDQRGGLLRRSVLAVIARVHAGVAHMLYGFIEWVTRQLFPDTAEGEYLRQRHAAPWGLTENTATAAGGDVTFTGSDGATVPAGTLLVRNDGTEYTTDSEAEIDDGEATVSVTASEVGTNGNADAGTALSLGSPINSVDSEATVGTDGLTGGAADESDDDLRTRLLQRIQNPPQGGSKPDYERWALEVSQVTRAWVFPAHLGLGTVGVTFVLDNEDPIIPPNAKVDEVQDYLDDRRPVTADLTVFAPEADPIDFVIALTPDTTDVREAVEAELKDMITRDAEPGGRIYQSRIREAISIASGETDHDLVSPTSDVVQSTGQIATFGSVTWQ